MMQFAQLNRREFITLLGGAAAAWPLAARAQQAEQMRRIGVLMNLAADDPEAPARIAAFAQGLADLGWSIGRNLRIDYRWGAGDAERIRREAAELLAAAPDVVLASGNPSAAALQQATRNVPIVFAGVNDPVSSGFVESLAQPGGNITGFSLFEYSFSGKWLELLKELSPRVMRAAILRDLGLASGSGQLGAIQSVAPSLGGGVDPAQRERRGRNRARAGCLRAFAEWRDDRDGKHAGVCAPEADHHVGGPAPIACGLPPAPIHRQRRLDFLRDGFDRSVSPRRRLCRSHPQRREAGRPTGAGADQVRAGDQSQDREGARPRSATNAARARRRGDRMSNCVVGSGESRLPCSTIAEHSVEGCDHFSHDGDDDDLGFFVGGGEAFVEGFEGGTVTACGGGGHVEGGTDRQPAHLKAAGFLQA